MQTIGFHSNECFHECLMPQRLLGKGWGMLGYQARLSQAAASKNYIEPFICPRSFSCPPRKHFLFGQCKRLTMGWMVCLIDKAWPSASKTRDTGCPFQTPVSNNQSRPIPKATRACSIKMLKKHFKRHYNESVQSTAGFISTKQNNTLKMNASTLLCY